MSPGPWKFNTSVYGINNAITDADGRIIAGSVNIDDGPLMAAAPELFALVAAVARRNDDLGARMRDELRRLNLG